MLKLQGVAVEVNSMVFLSIGRSKLVHDTAHHTGILMLTSLTYLSQLSTISLIVAHIHTHLFSKSTSCYHFQGSTTAQTCTCRHIAEIE